MSKPVRRRPDTPLARALHGLRTGWRRLTLPAASCEECGDPVDVGDPPGETTTADGRRVYLCLPCVVRVVKARRAAGVDVEVIERGARGGFAE